MRLYHLRMQVVARLSDLRFWFGSACLGTGFVLLVLSDLTDSFAIHVGVLGLVLTLALMSIWTLVLSFTFRGINSAVVLISLAALGLASAFTGVAISFAPPLAPVIVVFFAIAAGVLLVKSCEAAFRFNTSLEHVANVFGLRRERRSIYEAPAVAGYVGGTYVRVSEEDVTRSILVANSAIPPTLRLDKYYIPGRVLTGDTRLDAMANIAGTPYDVFARFDARTRDLARELAVDGVVLAAGTLQWSTLKTPVGFLLERVQAMLSLADALAREGDIRDRLADERAAVRLKAALVLLEHCVSRADYETYFDVLVRMLHDIDGLIQITAARILVQGESTPHALQEEAAAFLRNIDGAPGALSVAASPEGGELSEAIGRGRLALKRS